MDREYVKQKQAEMRAAYPDNYPEQKRTHCKRGHAFTPENLIKHQLYLYGVKACKTCDKKGAKRRYLEKKLKQGATQNGH